MRGAVVLCGGRSTRMGRDKATLPFAGETLLARSVRVVSAAVDEVVVVARPGQGLPPLPPAVKLAHDEVLDQGPLGGLVPGLRASSAAAVFVTGCDAPFLRRELIDLLFERLGDADVAVAEAERRLHPLAAVYRTRVLPTVERLLGERRLRPAYLFDLVPTVRVGEDALRRADPDLASLRNCNTPEAYTAALLDERRTTLTTEDPEDTEERQGGGPLASASAVAWFAGSTDPREARGAEARGSVRVEFYDVPRRRAGVESVEVQAATLGEARRRAAARCPGLAGEVVGPDGAPIEHFRANVNAERFVTDPATPLRPGDCVLLLSAQAGG